MDRPTTHRWLPFYFWILFTGVGATILPIYRALNLPGSGGYIFLGVLLIAIRAVTCWGMFTRKLWGWYLNFIALFLIPIVKVLIPLMYSYNAYDVKQLGGSAIAVSFFWLIYAIPNTIYFKKRKHLFDDGKGSYKTLFGGSGFRVLDPQSVSGFTASDAPSLGRTVEVPSIAVERDPVVKKVLAEVPIEIEECVLFDKEMGEEMATINLSDKSDEQFYEIAQREFDAGDIAKGFMLKAEVATGGDKEMARLFCIRTRAKELAQEAEKKANEERDLSSLRETLVGATETSKSADKFLKRIEQFRADYPDNAKIFELQAEFEYQCLEARIEEVYNDEYQPAVLFEKRLRMYDSFLAEHPEHPKRHEIEQKRLKYEGELVKIRDRNAFFTMKGKAEEFIRKHEYQAASGLYRGYLNQYSEYADKARKMVEETIPQLIKDEPARKRRVKCNLVAGAIIATVSVFILGFFVVKSAQLEQVAKLAREKSEQEAKLETEQEAKLACFLRSAEQGDAAAQCSLGVAYDSGQGVPQDYTEAIRWYRKAAEQGNAVAQNNLGLLYANGQGVSQDYTNAVIWCRKAAEQGNAEAQNNLGVLYNNGQGIPQNYTNAVIWYRKAAEQGHAAAQANLGKRYANGQGVPQDYTEAIKWYRKAAEQGDATAQNNLGLLYANGQGVPQNYTNAVIWYRKAAEQGLASAQFRLGVCLAYGRGVSRNPAEAISWLQKASEKQDDTTVLNNLAWFFATCPEDALRNGSRAVELAKKFLALRRPDDPVSLDTLAAAYAEIGQFDLAVETQKKAILFLKDPTKKEQEECLTHLQSYENKKPWRETPR